MSPAIPDSFWLHFPTWLWPVVVAGVAGLFLYEAIRGSKSVASLFGSLGHQIHARARRLKRIEDSLEQTNDKLDCAMEFLADDCAWHYEADVIIGENFPGLTKLLPHRMTFTQWKQRWAAGWRPDC